MSRTLRFSAFAIAVAALGATLSADAQQPAAVGAQPSGAEALPRPLRAKQILGTKILIQNNTGIGTVDDIVFSDSGDVEYLIVATADSKLVTVPWAATQFNVEQKSAIVNISQEQFKVVPTYTVTTYPQYFTPDYRTSVYKYYGVTPGQLRRIDRKIDRRP